MMRNSSVDVDPAGLITLAITEIDELQGVEGPKSKNL